MQNQGIAQVERQGEPEPGFDVIRAITCQDWGAGLRQAAVEGAESAVIGGNPGTFPGIEQAAQGRLGMHRPSPINTGVAAKGRLQEQAPRPRLVPGCLGSLP